MFSVFDYAEVPVVAERDDKLSQTLVRNPATKLTIERVHAGLTEGIAIDFFYGLVQILTEFRVCEERVFDALSVAL